MLTLEGKFVRLVPLDVGHASALVAASDENRSSYALATVPHDGLTMRQYIALARHDMECGRAIPFTTVDARTDRVVGSTRFMNIERWPAPFEPPPSKEHKPDAVEIGFTWLAASVQRTAINTEAKLLMLRHAFEVWKVHRVTLKTDARNLRSREAIERLGARLDGVLRAWQRAVEGGPRDTAVFSILIAEWPTVRATLEHALSRR